MDYDDIFIFNLDGLKLAMILVWTVSIRATCYLQKEKGGPAGGVSAVSPMAKSCSISRKNKEVLL